MKKNISRNPLWPDWYNGKKIDEVQFGRAFLEQWPLKCVNGTLYTLDGPVEDESEIKQRILENIEEYVTSGLSKKVTNILETIKLLAFSFRGYYCSCLYKSIRKGYLFKRNL